MRLHVARVALRGNVPEAQMSVAPRRDELMRIGPEGQRMQELVTSGALLLFLVPGAMSLVAIAYYQSAMLNESWGNLHVGPHRLSSRLKTWPLAGIYITNLLGMLVTLGLFYPWAKVRQMRYQVENTALLAAGDLDHIAAEGAPGANAVGEEIADFFDVDLSI